MCGIAGILRFGDRPPSRDEVERMTSSLAHRGPDGSGLHLEGPVGLGHRRLSIIDPEGGAQPMGIDDGRLQVTYNGEIYNFRELKAELEAQGRTFHTHSDTEVLLHAYDAWGEGCVERFRGMFAFCIADFERRRLFLARDPFGIKPLVVRRGDGYLAFASELGALREVDDAAPRGDLAGVELYLRYQYIPAPNTIYQGVLKVPPATCFHVAFDGTESALRRYWQLEFDPTSSVPGHASDWEDAAESVLDASVRAHLVADVPFGVFLSGGVDSTLVACAMQRILDRPVKAFSIGFQEAQYSELPYAEEAARTCGVELVTDVVREDALDLLPLLLRHYGEPFGDTSAIPTWHVARLARSEVPMVLSGDGGDEGFGGYHTYSAWMGLFAAAQVTRKLPWHPLRAFRMLRRHLRDSWKGKRRIALENWEKQLLYLRAPLRRRLWQPALRHLADAPSPAFEQAAAEAPRTDRLAYAQYLDTQTYLPSDILTKVDVASMSHGLEVRPPLIDRHVFEFAARLPLDQRLEVDRGGKVVGKALLRRLLRRRFPAGFVDRKKAGFSIPRQPWFRPGRKGDTMLRELLADAGGGLSALFDADVIREEMTRHAQGKDRSDVLALLLILGLWLDQNPEVSFS